MPERKILKPAPGSEKQAKGQLSASKAEKRLSAGLVEGGRKLFRRDSAADPFRQDGLGQTVPRVERRRKRRRSSAGEPVGCAGGEPPCYQHLLEDL